MAALHNDFMKNVKYKVELLVKKTKGWLHQGQYDFMDTAVLSVN